jgi:alpha-ketoglutarate-dependent taurine dioxygenase
MTRFETVELTPRVGTEIRADRETLLNGSRADELRDLLEARGVLIFRSLFFNDRDQKAFASTIGEVLPQGDDGISKITLDKSLNDTADYLRGAFYWHIDGASDDVPTRAAFLGAKTLSPTGGQTEFCNTYAAYDDLSDDEKQKIDGLKVIHSMENSQYYITPEPTYAELKGWHRLSEKIHPLVWTHGSGRKSLLLGSTASQIVGMSLRDSRELLVKFRDHATQRHNVYQHEWTEGDLLIWDNTGTMHRVLPYAIDSGRMMHRTTLVGEEQVA